MNALLRSRPMTTALPRLLLAALLAFALAGCTAPSDDPAKSFQLFLARVQEGRTGEAWKLLAKPSQEQLTALVNERIAGSGGAITGEPHQLVFGSAELVRPVEKVDVVSRDEARAVLRVTHLGGETRELVMLREPDGWKLSFDLPRG